MQNKEEWYNELSDIFKKNGINDFPIHDTEFDDTEFDDSYYDDMTPQETFEMEISYWGE